MQTESTQQELTDLGKDVERAIEEFWLNCQQHGDPKKLAMIDCGPCKIALDILKNAIRTRIDEPRPTPAYVHACPIQDLESLRAIVGILSDWPRVEGNANTAELRSRYARFLDRWISRYTSEAGFFDGFPLPPMSAREPQFVEEPLPQHTFERRHVGEPIKRTSKHSVKALVEELRPLPWEPFLNRFPQIARIGTPVAEGEDPEMTIITARHFKALAETVDLLIAERNAKL